MISAQLGFVRQRGKRCTATRVRLCRYRVVYVVDIEHWIQH